MHLNNTKYISQAGFTLFELMIAIGVIAILTAIGVPAYKGYIQKAALTDMLQVMSPYKTAVELCALEQGKLTGCNNGSKGIPSSRTSNYVTSVVISSGVITITGQNTLTGLTTTISPTIDSTDGQINWTRSCTTSPTNQSLEDACHDIFRF